MKDIELFEEKLKREEKSAATVEKYIRDCIKFSEYSFQFSEKNRDEKAGVRLTKETVIAYKNHLIEKGYAKRSINSVIASLNSFFEFIGRGDLKMKALKIQHEIFRSEEKELTKGEYERLCRAAREKKNGRLEMILQTVCATGIRVSELKYITVEALKTGQVTVSLKGKTRTVFLVKELRRKLVSYCRENGITEGQIFITKSGKAMNRTNIWREMKSLCKAAKVNPDKVFPHNLRHLFARIFYSIDKDIAKLADILGHSSIETTRIYIISTGSEHKRRMEKMHLII